MEATGLPNDRFWIPKIAKFVSKVAAVTGDTVKTKLQKPTCFQTLHKKTKTLKTTKNQETQQGR